MIVLVGPNGCGKSTLLRRVALRPALLPQGSMSPAGRFLINRRLIEAPVDAIDYVITHELCHIAEPNHGAAFYELLDRVLPDWQHRKQRLERIMAWQIPIPVTTVAGGTAVELNSKPNVNLIH